MRLEGIAMKIDDLMQQLPIDQIAERLGVSHDEARRASQAAVSALLGGMGENAKDPAGAASLEGALAQHSAPVHNLAEVDATDGDKIVGHVFGSSTDQIVNQLGSIKGGGGSGLAAKVLPLLAPIVMGWLAKQFTGGTTAKAEGNNGLGGLLDGVLGSLSGTKHGETGIDFGNIIGGLNGMLGGGTRR